MSRISDAYLRIREELPESVRIVAACKTRSAEEVAELIDAGAEEIGYNYVQEAAAIRSALGFKAERVIWHMLGGLQRNKVNIALSCFDVIQTVDSLQLAETLNERASRLGKTTVVYIEINSAREPQKSGVMPDDAASLAVQIARLDHVRLEGLMTMGPFTDDPEKVRPYFRETKQLFDRLRSSGNFTSLTALSMGMSDTYRVAVEEGSTMVRLGTILFGERRPKERS